MPSLDRSILDARLREAAEAIEAALDVDSVTITEDAPDEPPLPTVLAAPELEEPTQADRKVTLVWEPVPDAVKYDVFALSTPEGPVATVTEPTRTSGAQSVGRTLVYWVVAIDAVGVRSPESNRVTIEIEASEPEPTPPSSGTLTPEQWNAGYDAAFATGDHEKVRAWLDARQFGPASPTGVVSGDTRVITTQAQADALSGKRVTCYVEFKGSGSITVKNVFFDGGRVQVFSGSVRFEDVLMDARNGTKHPNYWRQPGGKMHLERVKIVRNQDGMQTYGQEVTGNIVYISKPSPELGGLSGNNTHQDAWQHMRGPLRVQRAFLDYRGSVTSCVMLKTDAGDASIIDFGKTVFVRNGIVFHVHDNGDRTIQDIDLSGNMLATTSSGSYASVWQVNTKVKNILAATDILVSKSNPRRPGALVKIRDAAKLT